LGAETLAQPGAFWFCESYGQNDLLVDSGSDLLRILRVIW
jgi:hypothetical protein